ncbi:MAG TPA: N-6 DNA methylase, partial [Verrucomicrobiae bacterium]
MVFKRHEILDAPGFQIDEKPFRIICDELSDPTSPYNFDSIPLHILGSIYERFLGKIITDNARVEEKPEVRKAGGVYYTPEYIVRFIVAHTVGQAVAGKTPAEIAEMRFADIACGSGSFLLEVFDSLLRHYTKYYNENPGKVKKGDCLQRDDGLHLSLKKKQEILRKNIYGVDIDRQAVEVAQLSLYLKLLEDETIGSTAAFQNEFHFTLLPPMTDNIVCGNSLIGPDILDGGKFTPDEEKKLNPMDYAQRFPQIFRRKISSDELRDAAPGDLEHNVSGGMPLHGSYAKVSYRKTKKGKPVALTETEYEGGFDAIVGNPPYIPIESMSVAERNYFQKYFNELERKYDSSVIFILAALRKLTVAGRIGFISSITWQTGENYSRLRQTLFQKAGVLNLVNLPFDVFKDAYVDTGVYILCRKPVAQYSIYRFPKKTKISSLEDLVFTEVDSALVAAPEFKIILEPTSQKILSRVLQSTDFVVFGQITESTQGLAASFFKTSSSQKSEDWFSFAKGAHVYRYE